MKGGNCILLVEDDWNFQGAVAQLLMDLGYYVSTASSGEAAKRFLESKPSPTLVVTDLHMPDCDGLELRAWMLNHPEFHKIPAILFSGDPHALQKGHALQFAAIISKADWLVTLPLAISRLFKPR